MQGLRPLTTLKCDLIFLIFENRHEFDRTHRLMFDHAMHECGVTDTSKWLAVKQEDLRFLSGDFVKDIYGQGHSTLGEVLFRSPDTPRVQNHILDRMAKDLTAKQKVWGRAYQRAVSKK